MGNISNLENKQKELLNNLSESELKQYIKVLTNNYYSSFFSNDKQLYETTLKQLEEVNSIYKVEYSDFNNYINFCLLNTIHNMLNENTNSEISLKLIESSENDYFSSNPFKNLINAFKESRALYHEGEQYQKRIKELERELAKYEEGVKTNG